MMANLELHTLNIWDLRLRHSENFQFQNRESYTKFTDRLILDYHPSVYIRYENDYNREKLQIKMSWCIITRLLSFGFLIFAFVTFTNIQVSFTFMGFSVCFFLLSNWQAFKYKRFAFDMDITKELLTEELVEKVKSELQSSKQ